jgi:CDP-paratose 2-epimerase
LECIQLIEDISGYRVNYTYHEQNRIGDHICYMSDLRKLMRHYSEWSITRSLPHIIEEMISAEANKQPA